MAFKRVGKIGPCHLEWRRLHLGDGSEVAQHAELEGTSLATRTSGKIIVSLIVSLSTPMCRPLRDSNSTSLSTIQTLLTASRQRYSRCRSLRSSCSFAWCKSLGTWRTIRGLFGSSRINSSRRASTCLWMPTLPPKRLC